MVRNSSVLALGMCDSVVQGRWESCVQRGRPVLLSLSVIQTHSETDTEMSSDRFCDTSSGEQKVIAYYP